LIKNIRDFNWKIFGEKKLLQLKKMAAKKQPRRKFGNFEKF